LLRCFFFIFSSPLYISSFVISTFLTGYKQWRSSVVSTVINLRIP
jgi:hypothetical protein